MANSKKRARIGGAGRQREYTEGEKEGLRSKKMRGGCWGPATQPPGHPATPPPSQPRNKSESNIHRTKKKKTPETKGRWDNLRKAV